MTRTHPTRRTAGPTVRELIAELARTEDDLRTVRDGGSVEHRLRVARHQAGIVRELRRRRGRLG